MRAVRQHLGWSQERLAEKAKLHRTYVAGIERGERNPTLSSMVRIARALGTTPSELLEGIK
ncbi:MAG: helix-turn-helix transcriptional regulator [Polyangiales bacterium]